MWPFLKKPEPPKEVPPPAVPEVKLVGAELHVNIDPGSRPQVLRNLTRMRRLHDELLRTGDMSRRTALEEELNRRRLKLMAAGFEGLDTLDGIDRLLEEVKRNG